MTEAPVPGNTINYAALFVSGLDPSVEFTDLHAHFETYGKIVLARVLKDAKTGISRGIGYVNFADSASASAAQEATDNQPGPKGTQPIVVKFAEADPTYRAVETKRVFVRFIPSTVTADQFRAAFSAYGVIADLVFESDRNRQTPDAPPSEWSYAYVRYNSSKDANAAVARAASEIRWGPRPLVVKPAEGHETRKLRMARRQMTMNAPMPSITIGVQPPPPQRQSSVNVAVPTALFPSAAAPSVTASSMMIPGMSTIELSAVQPPPPSPLYPTYYSSASSLPSLYQLQSLTSHYNATSLPQMLPLHPTALAPQSYVMQPGLHTVDTLPGVVCVTPTSLAVPMTRPLAPWETAAAMALPPPTPPY